MDERAFIIQQIGANDSAERRRADEIYEGIIIPAVKDAGLKRIGPISISPLELSHRKCSQNF